jgi:hypothetical protein
MEAALSMKTGAVVRADRSDYDSGRLLLLVCPECREPVQLRRRQIPNVISYFAHPELKDRSQRDLCTLRVLGSWSEEYSNSGTWSSHGQLMRRFQLELVSYFIDQFRVGQSSILTFLQDSIRMRKSLSSSQRELLEGLAASRRTTIFDKLRQLAFLSDSEGSEISEAYAVIIDCLRSQHTEIAAMGLTLCCSLTASSLTEEHYKWGDLQFRAKSKSSIADFAIDPDALKQFLQRRHLFPRAKTRQFDRTLALCQYLILRLLIHWRYPDSLQNERFILVSSNPEVGSRARAQFPVVVPAASNGTQSSPTNAESDEVTKLKKKYHPHLLGRSRS